MSEFKSSADWKARYDEQHTPWDRGVAHPELEARLASGELAPAQAGARVLVPGCGRGHDALALARAGWCVTAVDFVGDLAAELGAALAPSGGRFITADALAFAGEPPYDLIWEHTFFCAIEPQQRPAWGQMVRRNLAATGHLAALIFPADKPVAAGGPPHGYCVDEMLAALGEGFTLECADELESTLEGRDWLEVYARFSRE